MVWFWFWFWEARSCPTFIVLSHMPQAYARSELAAVPSAPRTWWGTVQIHALGTHPERDGEHEKCGSRIPALEQTTVAIQAPQAALDGSTMGMPQSRSVATAAGKWVDSGKATPRPHPSFIWPPPSAVSCASSVPRTLPAVSVHLMPLSRGRSASPANPIPSDQRRGPNASFATACYSHSALGCGFLLSLGRKQSLASEGTTWGTLFQTATLV